VRTVASLKLSKPFDFQSPFPGKEFAAWIIAAESSLSDAEKKRVADSLIGAGCRYAVCSGLDSSSWDDAVDLAYIDRYPDSDADDSRFVMTTWHDDESLDDIADFFVLNTSFDFFVPEYFLVVGIGSEASIGDAVERVQVRLTSSAT